MPLSGRDRCEYWFGIYLKIHNEKWFDDLRRESDEKGLGWQIGLDPEWDVFTVVGPPEALEELDAKGLCEDFHSMIEDAFDVEWAKDPVSLMKRMEAIVLGDEPVKVSFTKYSDILDSQFWATVADLDVAEDLEAMLKRGEQNVGLYRIGGRFRIVK